MCCSGMRDVHKARKVLHIVRDNNVIRTPFLYNLALATYVEVIKSKSYKGQACQWNGDGQRQLSVSLFFYECK